MVCNICGVVYEGRPNRRYCSIRCRRTAESQARLRRLEVRRDAYLASMTREQRAFYDAIPGPELLWTEVFSGERDARIET